MSAVVHDHGHAHDDHGHGHHGPYGGIMRWITTTNHKDIGQDEFDRLAALVEGHGEVMKDESDEG